MVCKTVKGEDDLKGNVSREMSCMWAHTSHTKIAIIGGRINQLLSGRGGVVDEKAHQCLLKTAKELNSLAEIMSDYILASTPDKGCPKEFVDIYPDIIAKLEKEFIKELKEKNITVYFQPDMMDIDKVLIKINKPVFKISLRDLLANAIHHTPINGTIILDFRREDGMYKFSVFDTGKSIPPSKQKLIFDVFQSDKSFGIGLFALRKLIRRHGGELWYETSLDGKHAIFCFTIPEE
jgi:signal transduction histidine kinase